VTIHEAISRHEPNLRAGGIEMPLVELEWMLAHLLDIRRGELSVNDARKLTQPEAAQLACWVAERSRRVPLQHLLGTADFHEIRLRSDQRALIPRPETEMLVERAIDFLRAKDTPRVLDIGTGSGCIAISVATACLNGEVEALDVSEDALALARENAIDAGVADRLQFLKADCRYNLPTGPFDLVVSNPPYIPTKEIDGLQPEVRDHDPHLALDGGADGLDFYRVLVANTAAILRQNGRLMLEMGHEQSPAVCALLETHRWSSIQVHEDLAGIPRIVIATPANS